MPTDSTFLEGRAGFEVLAAEGYPEESKEGFFLVWFFRIVRLLGLRLI